MRLLRIYAKFIPNVWHKAAPILKKAVDRNFDEMTIDDHYVSCRDGDSTLWLAAENNDITAAGTTEFSVYPRKKILRIVLFASATGRDFDAFEPFLEQVEAYGVAHGCTDVEAWVRKGFARKLKWDHEYCIISKPIKGEIKHGR